MMIRKWLSGLAAGVALQSLSAGLAQAGATSLEILAQGGAITVKQGGTRNWVVEVLIVVVLFGLALFVICKSSRRV
jgi:hypothetical protein